MLRKLPPTITADKTPEWLPAGWIAQSKVLKRGRETRTYTQLKTGKKFFTKDHVLRYIEMEKAREKRDLGIERAKLKAYSFFQHRDTSTERTSWLPDTWEMEFRTGSTSGNRYIETMEAEASLDKTEETGCDYISYEYGDEDLSENEYAEGFKEDMENFCNISSTSLRSNPERMRKMESQARTQCVFADKEMSSFSDDILPKAEALIEKGHTEINAAEEENLHDVVIEFDENASGLTGSSEAHLKAKAAQEEKKCAEETVNEFGRSVFFPSGDAPAHSVIIFGTSKATSSLGELSDTVGFELNKKTSSSKNICSSKKRKLSKKISSSKNMKKKDTETPCKPTKKPQKLKIPSIPQGESSLEAVWKRGSSSKVMEQSLEYWPDLCSTFPFEPITSRIEDDSVIRRYLEQHATAAASADSNLPLPDFGLPNFSDIKISLDEETDKQPAFTKNKSHVNPCIQIASSSLPSCSSMATMQQTVAGN